MKHSDNKIFCITSELYTTYVTKVINFMNSWRRWRRYLWVSRKWFNTRIKMYRIYCEYIWFNGQWRGVTYDSGPKPIHPYISSVSIRDIYLCRCYIFRHHHIFTLSVLVRTIRVAKWFLRYTGIKKHSGYGTDRSLKINWA